MIRFDFRSYWTILMLCIGAFVSLRGVESYQDTICQLVLNKNIYKSYHM
jgi:hypothetical protein